MPFGEPRLAGDDILTDRLFTGQRDIPSIDLMFYNARWYDSSLGRFAQADTIVPSHQGVQAWDRYAYVNNNPVNYTDPTGHVICSEEGGCRDGTRVQGGDYAHSPRKQRGGGRSISDAHMPQATTIEKTEEPGLPLVPNHIYDIRSEDSVYLSLSAHTEYHDIESSHPIFLLFAALNVRTYLLTNSEWYPTLLGEMWNQSPDASSSLSYHYVASGIQTDAQQGIIIDSLMVSNHLDTEALMTNVNMEIYDGSVLVGQGQGVYNIAPNSSINFVSGFVPSSVTEIVIDIYLDSITYSGEMQHIINP